MEKRIVAENTLTYREIDKNELHTFQKKKNVRRHKRRRRDIFDYRKKLFTSNNRQFIMMANGLQTDVAKGSDEEWMFWHVKDSYYSSGHNYYFDSPENAERVLRVQYPTILKQKWHERVIAYRNVDDGDNDEESSVNDLTIIK